MKPVMQTIFGDNGNCMQACVASLLELPLDDVPQFPIQGQFLALERYLKQFDIQPVGYPVATIRPHNVYYIGTDMSTRGRRHAVVCKNLLVVHDPHPDNAGIADPDIDYFFFRRFYGVQP